MGEKPQVTYDKEAKAFYITVARGGVARTIPAKGEILVDLDADGNIMGVEVILYEETMP